jgi:hypothetical protein
MVHEMQVALFLRPKILHLSEGEIAAERFPIEDCDPPVHALAWIRWEISPTIPYRVPCQILRFNERACEIRVRPLEGLSEPIPPVDAWIWRDAVSVPQPRRGR